jgi:SsrA-binding protein
MKKDTLIAQNKRAYFDYHIDEQIEAGIVLEGWEVKALRLGYGQLTDSYALIRQQEIFLLNAKIQTPQFAALHVHSESERTRKLLLKKKEILKLQGAIQRQGHTLIPLKLYWDPTGRYVKCLIGVAKGKTLVDKRVSIADKEWVREKQRIAKQHRLN